MFGSLKLALSLKFIYFYLSGPAKPASGPAKPPTNKPPVASNSAKPSAPPVEKKVASQVLSFKDALNMVETN